MLKDDTEEKANRNKSEREEETTQFYWCYVSGTALGHTTGKTPLSCLVSHILISVSTIQAPVSQYKLFFFHFLFFL